MGSQRGYIQPGPLAPSQLVCRPPRGWGVAFLYLCLKLPFQHLKGSRVKVLGATQGQDTYEIGVGTS